EQRDGPRAGREHGLDVPVLPRRAFAGGYGGLDRHRPRGDGVAHSEHSSGPRFGHRSAAEGGLMAAVPLKYNVRNLIVRKRTTLAAAFGIALVVFVVASVQMLIAGLHKTLGRGASEDVAIVLRKGSDTELPSGIEDKYVSMVIASAQQVGATKKPMAVGEVVVVILLDKIGANGVSNVQVRGVPEDAMAFRPTAKIIEGRAPNPGSDEVIVGNAIKGRFKGLEVGGTFELKKNRNVKVVGIFEDGGSAFESE